MGVIVVAGLWCISIGLLRSYTPPPSPGLRENCTRGSAYSYDDYRRYQATVNRKLLYSGFLKNNGG
jgi:hypothetical protein